MQRNFVNPLHLILEAATSIPEEMVLILKGVGDGEYVYPIALVSEMINMDPGFVHKNLKIMRSNGLVTFSHLTREDDNLVCGSGYFRSSFGDEVLEYIESQREHVQPISGPH